METKKCTNCSRSPQPIKDFVNSKGKECNTCSKCREKGRKNDKTEKRREQKNKLQNEKKYYKAWREKKSAEEDKKHNNEVHKEWKKNNPNYVAQWNRTNANARLDSIKRSATKRQIEWKLDDEVAKEMLTKPCVYCGHLNINKRLNGIDRMDSSDSYCIENCVTCCKDCNFMKGEYDPKTFIERCRIISRCDFQFPDVKRCTENRFAPRVSTPDLLNS